MREEGRAWRKRLHGLSASTGRARAIRFAWPMPMESAWGNEPLRIADWGLRSCGIGATPEVIGVAIEMTQGPVVEALLERGFCVYGINPKQLDRFRDRFTVAGAKDDRRDAHVLADSLRTDRHAFRRLSTDGLPPRGYLASKPRSSAARIGKASTS